MANDKRLGFRINDELLTWLELQTNDGYKTKTDIIINILTQYKDGYLCKKDIMSNSIKQELSGIKKQLRDLAKQKGITNDELLVYLFNNDLPAVEHYYFYPNDLSFIAKRSDDLKTDCRDLVRNLLNFTKNKHIEEFKDYIQKQDW